MAKTCYCKGCGKEIVWIRTGKGKSMPCDPEYVTYPAATAFKGDRK